VCGIAGVIGGGADVRRMTDRLRHRGPDDEGFLDGVLGFRRLSIVDLAGGRQPMQGCRGQWLVLNGEIYNHRELRARLPGHTFRSQSDAEVVLHLFEEKGEACVHELDGMFAFAVWDPERRRLFAARDRLGKKPFVYRHHGGEFHFASEIAALEGPRVIDREALDLYFALGYIPAPWTIVTGIRKLPPAHTLVFDGEEVTVSRYWEPRLERREQPEEASVARLEEILTRAVRKRLQADVPVGAFLSGGLDSSIVSGLMSRMQPTKTFSVGFREEAFDESRYARVASKHFRTEHHEEKITPRAVDVLPILVERFGEPFGDPAALPTYHLAQTASRRVKVVLSGDGADELFGGYRRYEALRRVAAFRRWPRLLAASGAWAVRAWRSNYGQRVARLLDAPASRTLGELYGDLVGIYTAPMRTALGLAGGPLSCLTEPFEKAGTEADGAAAYADLVCYLPHDLLVKVDIAAMAHGLEVRCPFLDPDVVELALGLPPELRRGKPILKRAFRGLLPETILRRPKRGFGLPVAAWLRGELQPLLDDAVNSLSARGIVETGAIRRLVEEHRSRKADHADRLWLVLVLELWARRFL
jgi:asparagine synthase (glutamine-hydrolysing)